MERTGPVPCQPGERPERERRREPELRYPEHPLPRLVVALIDRSPEGGDADGVHDEQHDASHGTAREDAAEEAVHAPSPLPHSALWSLRRRTPEFSNRPRSHACPPVERKARPVCCNVWFRSRSCGRLL